jgi:hypothetical protein
MNEPGYPIPPSELARLAAYVHKPDDRAIMIPCAQPAASYPQSQTATWTADDISALVTAEHRVNSLPFRGRDAGTLLLHRSQAERDKAGKWTASATLTPVECIPELLTTGLTAEQIFGTVDFSAVIPADAVIR